MIAAAAIIVGVLAGLAGGGSLRNLRHSRLRYEGVLFVLLLCQLLLPLLHLSGLAAKVGFSLWFATFPIMAAVALANRDKPGMWLVTVGLLCNALVIGLNLGMPVSPAAAAAIGIPQPLRMVGGDFVHVLAGHGTRALALADVLPVPGMRGVVSPGDLLLLAGVAVFVAGEMSPAVRRARAVTFDSAE